MAILLQLAVLLLQRRNEFAGLMASEVNVDLAQWLIPRLAHEGQTRAPRALTATIGRAGARGVEACRPRAPATR